MAVNKNNKKIKASSKRKKTPTKTKHTSKQKNNPSEQPNFSIKEISKLIDTKIQNHLFIQSTIQSYQKFNPSSLTELSLIGPAVNPLGPHLWFSDYLRFIYEIYVKFPQKIQDQINRITLDLPMGGASVTEPRPPVALLMTIRDLVLEAKDLLEQANFQEGKEKLEEASRLANSQEMENAFSNTRSGMILADIKYELNFMARFVSSLHGTD